jgi:hypothetical protein
LSFKSEAQIRSVSLSIIVAFCCLNRKKDQTSWDLKLNGTHLGIKRNGKYIGVNLPLGYYPANGDNELAITEARDLINEVVG